MNPIPLPLTPASIIPGGYELVIILVVVLLLFGGKKIPELMRGVGKGVGELQKGLEEGKRTLNDAIQYEANKPEETVVTKSATPIGTSPEVTTGTTVATPTANPPTA